MDLETVIKQLEQHNTEYPKHPNDCPDLDMCAVKIHSWLISTQPNVKIRNQMFNIFLRVLQWEQAKKGSATGPLPKIPAQE